GWTLWSWRRGLLYRECRSQFEKMRFLLPFSATWSKLLMSSALGRRRGPCEPPAERGLPGALFFARRALPPLAYVADHPRHSDNTFISQLSVVRRPSRRLGTMVCTSTERHLPFCN